MKALLSLDKVSLVCGNDCRLLSSISLSVEEGESLAIVGRNGSGKSSLLKILIGIFRSIEGRILVAGKDIQTLSIAERAKIFGYVPQMIDGLPMISAREFVLLSTLSVSGFRMYRKEDIARAEAALGFFSVNHLKSRPVSQLSGGERQRVLLAAAIAHEPKILLLDEPAAFLDPVAQNDLIELLCRLRENKQFATLAVSHDIARSREWATRAVGLASGGLVFDGSPEELTKPEIYQKIFLGQTSLPGVLGVS